MHKLNEKERYFCLEKRDYISHEIDEPITCDKYLPIEPRREKQVIHVTGD
jgi:hypothetical protein